MHIKDENNNRFITEEEYTEIKSEFEYGLSKDELNQQQEEENTYHNYILNHKTPEQIIRSKFESYNEKLKSLFIGTEVQVFEADSEFNETKLIALVDDLNSQSSDKFYTLFQNDEAKYFIIEHLRGQPANIHSISNLILSSIQSEQIDVV